MRIMLIRDENNGTLECYCTSGPRRQPHTPDVGPKESS